MPFRGGNGGVPLHSPPFKIATSQSDGLGMKNVVKLCTSDVSRSSGVFAIELCCEFWCGDFGSGLPGIVFAAISLPLNEVLESSLVPTTVEYFLYFPLHFSIDDYGQWVVLRCASCNSVIQGQSKLHYVEHWMELLHPVVTPLENFLRKCNMGYTLYPWISLLESTLETSYKPQT